jgi:CRISPR-associated protein Csm3
MKLNNILKISGKIELLTGLHIGSGNNEMHIGGTDSPVIKNPITQEPYIPGSSIKGKMRSLLEWELGVVGDVASMEGGKGKPLSFQHVLSLSPNMRQGASNILSLFGGAPSANPKKELEELIIQIGPTRLAFWDCKLNEKWIKEIKSRNILPTEVKMENSIDRIRGTAEHPRNTERVPAGAIFDFVLSMRVHEGDNEDLTDTLLRGLKLLELTGLGGSGSRGYGKIKITLENADLQTRLENFTLDMAA